MLAGGCRSTDVADADLPECGGMFRWVVPSCMFVLCLRLRILHVCQPAC